MEVNAKRSAFSNHLVELNFEPSTSANRDIESCIEELYPVVEQVLFSRLKDLPPSFVLKFSVRIHILLEKLSFENENNERQMIEDDPWFVSPAAVLLTCEDIKEKLKLSFSKCVANLDTYVSGGSGWSVKKILNARLLMCPFKVFSGGCNKKNLPPFLAKSKSVLSLPGTDDDKCFLHAVALALYKVQSSNNVRMHKVYRDLLKLFPSDFLTFPVDLKSVKQFEKKTPISVNVFGYEDKQLVPLYVSTLTYKRFSVDILLYKDHYYAIRNLASLVRKGTRNHRRKCFVCRMCLSYFVNKEKFELHRNLCLNRESTSSHQPLEMPDPDDMQMYFKNYKNLVVAPFVIYADLESSIAEEQKAAAGVKGKLLSSRKHETIAWATYTLCRANDEYSSAKPVAYVGENAMDKFLHHMDQETARIRHLLQNVQKPLCMRAEDQNAYDSAKQCAMCERKFGHGLRKVRDHCHLSGQYRNALCANCNLTYGKTRQKVVCLFHGLSNYDSHFIVQRLHMKNDRRLRIIPRTSEKYLALTVDEIEFKDSCQFLSESLCTLAQNLKSKGEEAFSCVRKFVSDEDQRQLLYQKGVFPYNYITNLQVLEEEQLPAKIHFANDLSKTEISDKDYAFAEKVWDAFGCNNLQDYLLNYLITDVLLLADCFEHFRSNCISGYQLDPVHYYSNAHFTFDAFLRRSKVSLDLFLDVNMHLFVAKGIRGGLSMVSCVRHSKANNKYMRNYDPSLPSKYILYLDCTNLYGYVMKMHLPTGEFGWEKPTPALLQHIIKCPSDAERGYFLEVDLEYPQQLHDLHQDYPLAPDRKAVSLNELSPTARDICLKNNLKHSVGTPKLMSTLENKTNYVIHYRTLQLYLSLGMRVTRVHNVISFHQAPVMKDYIDFNSAKRAAATNAFDTNYYKFLNNSLFGKTMERVDKKTIIKLVNNPQSFSDCVAKATFKNCKVINENLVGVEMRHPVLKINKPTYLGFTILDLAKCVMFDFHYNVMKAHFGERIKLVYTDTDSLLYLLVGVEDMYEEFALLPDNCFDFSNYPRTHKLYTESNKKVPGTFKDECAGKQIASFVGLRSKMYCMTFDDPEEPIVKVAKGVKRAVIEKDLKYDMYLRCLTESVQYEHSFHTISSRAHSVHTTFQNKITLSSFDDKRWLVNNYESLPYGHYKCA